MAAQSTEEVWNVKELVKRVAICVADGEPHPVSFVRGRVGHVNEGLEARVGSDLAAFLRQFHSTWFTVADGDGDGEPTITITPAGVQKYCAAPAEDVVEPNEELANEFRSKVFAEMNQRVTGTDAEADAGAQALRDEAFGQLAEIARAREASE